MQNALHQKAIASDVLKFANYIIPIKDESLEVNNNIPI